MNAAIAKATPVPASDPQTGWRNYRTAPFWFIPRPLANKDEVIENLKALIKQWYVDPSAISSTASEVHVAIGEIRFEVNFEYGVVGASAPDSHGGWDNPLGNDYPEKFADAIFDPTCKERYREDFERARMLAGRISDRFQSRLKSAVASGAAHVMARVGSPLAPFDRISPDTWRYFKMRPITEDTDDIPFHDYEFEIETIADGPAGEVLYSVMFAPGSLPKRNPGRPQISHSHVKPIAEFLRVYTRQPRPEELRKKNLMKIAEEKFGTIEDADQRRVWDLVKKDKEFHRSWEGGGASKKPAQK